MMIANAMPMNMPQQNMPMMGGMNPMMMGGMMPMMGGMTCEMTKDGMMVKMMSMEGQDMAMMKEACDAMNFMMAMGAPMMMMCNGMPMMMGMAK